MPNANAVNIPIGVTVTDLVAGFKLGTQTVGQFTAEFKAKFDGLKGSADAPTGALSSISRQLTITKRQISDLIAVGAPIPSELTSKFVLLKGSVDAVKNAFVEPVKVAPFAALNQELAQTKTRMQDLLAVGSPVSAELTAKYQRLESQIAGVNNEFAKTPSRLEKIVSFGGKLQSFGRSFSYLTAGLAFAGGVSFKNYAELDGIQRALAVTTGSVKEANKQFGEFIELAKLPGLGIAEVTQASLGFENLGLQAQTAERYVSELGNAIALSGKGKVEFEQVTNQLIQMSSKRSVNQDDLKPILNASSVIAKAVTEMFGTIDPEQISDKLKAVGRGPKDFIEDLINSLSKLERVSGGPKNALENFGDSVKLAELRFGSAADKALGLTSKLEGLGNFVGSASEGFANLSTGSQLAILGLTGVAATIGPLALGIGTVLSVLPTLQAGFGKLGAAITFFTGPVGAVIVAVAATVATLAVLRNAIQGYDANLETTIDKTKLLADVNGKVTESIGSETTKLTSLLAIARDETISKQARLRAISDINALSPQYLSNLSLETINTTQAANAINQYTNALQLRAKVQILAQESARNAIELDKVRAKSAKDYVDRNRFSGDQIDINIKTTASFSPQEDADRLFDELGKKRKNAEEKRLLETQKTLDDQYKKAYTEAAKQNIVVEPPKFKPFDYSKILIGSESDLQKAKDKLKKLKEEIFADDKKGLDTTAKVAAAKALKADIDAASDALKKPKEAKTSLQDAQKELSQLGEQIKDFDFRKITPSADLIKRYTELEERIDRANAALLRLKPVDLNNIKPLEGIATAKRGGDIIDQVTGRNALPGLAAFLDRAKIQVAEAKNKIGETVDSLNTELTARFSRSFSGQNVGLGELAAIFSNTQVDLQNKVDAFKNYLGIAKDQLQLAGVGLLESFGSAIGSGKNPLQSTLKTLVGFIGDFAIKLGSAILLAGKLEAGAAALTGPFGALFALEGAAKIAAGAGLVIGGAAIKAFALEAGGLAKGPTYALIGESSRARAGGGELVTSVRQGTDLIADGILKKLNLDNNKVSTPNPRYLRSQSQTINITGKLTAEAGDLVYVFNQYNSSLVYTS